MSNKPQQTALEPRATAAAAENVNAAEPPPENSDVAANTTATSIPSTSATAAAESDTVSAGAGNFNKVSAAELQFAMSIFDGPSTASGRRKAFDTLRRAADDGVVDAMVPLAE